MIILLLFLKHNNGVALQVAHIDGGSLQLDIRVLLDHQPAHVRKEEATRIVVGIAVGIGELVMSSATNNFRLLLKELHKKHFIVFPVDGRLLLLFLDIIRNQLEVFTLQLQ